MNKVDELAQKLRMLLAGGSYRIGARFPSEYEWVDRYHVSRLTANKAMALLTAEGLLRRGKRGEGTFVQNTIPFPVGYFFLFCTVTQSYACKVADGLIRKAYEHNYLINILNPEQAQFSSCLDRLKNSNCLGGFSIFFGMLPDNFPKKVIYLDSGVPEDGPYRHSICSAGYDAAREMMTAVLNAGYREIVVAAGVSTLACRRRVDGFLDVLKEAGYTDVQDRFFRVTGGSDYINEQMFQQICRRFPKREIIVTDSDDAAFVVLTMLHKHNIAFPEEVGVTGFGRIHAISDLYRFPTVDQHPEYMGATAFSAMLDMISHGEPEQPLRIEIPCELVNMEYLTRTRHQKK